MWSDRLRNRLGWPQICLDILAIVTGIIVNVVIATVLDLLIEGFVQFFTHLSFVGWVIVVIIIFIGPGVAIALLSSVALYPVLVITTVAVISGRREPEHKLSLAILNFVVGFVGGIVIELIFFRIFFGLHFSEYLLQWLSQLDHTFPLLGTLGLPIAMGIVLVGLVGLNKNARW